MSMTLAERDDIRPGIVVNLGNLNDNERHALAGSPLDSWGSRCFAWALYVVLLDVEAGTVSGPVITDGRAGTWPVTTWATVTLDNLYNGRDRIYTYPLTDVPAWVQNVGTFLAQSANRVDTSTPTPDVAEAVRQARQEQREEDRRAFEAWKERATETAHEYANNNSLCVEFDKCMRDIGLRGRERQYRVDVRLDTHVYVTAATNEEAETRACDALRVFDQYESEDEEGHGTSIHVDDTTPEDAEIYS